MPFELYMNPVGEECAGGLFFLQFSLKNYPLNVNTCVIIKQLKCCQSCLMFKMLKIFPPPSYSHLTVTDSLQARFEQNTSMFFLVFFFFFFFLMWLGLEKGCWQVFCLKLPCETLIPETRTVCHFPSHTPIQHLPLAVQKHTFRIPGNKFD